MVEKIIELAKENLSIDGEITATSSFKEDLEVDSLDLMELVMALEDEFNVEIPSEELQNIKTVQDVADYLTSKGLSVNSLVFLISSLTTSAGAFAAPIIPSPPAFDTAAAK